MEFTSILWWLLGPLLTGSSTYWMAKNKTIWERDRPPKWLCYAVIGISLIPVVGVVIGILWAGVVAAGHPSMKGEI